MPTAPASNAVCAITSSRVTSPSARPSVNAKPELVVASALKPSSSSIRAEPASHGFGITNGSPSWRARNSSALGELVLIGCNRALVALLVGGTRRRVDRAPHLVNPERPGPVAQARGHGQRHADERRGPCRHVHLQ